jgi:hypothetical protein
MRIWSAVPAVLAGALLGLRSQLYYLSSVSWEEPYLRVAIGILAGGSLFGFLDYGLVRVLKRLAPAWQVRISLSFAWSLLFVTLLACFFWDSLIENGLFFMLSAPFVLFLGLGFLWGKYQNQKLSLGSLWPALLGAVLLAGLGLRLSGISHGLPDFICHCDTPKQLALLPSFMAGDLIPPTSYPVGHIYMYAAILKALFAVLPLEQPNAVLTSFTLPEFSIYILLARGLQSLIGAVIPLLAFLTARRLWGTGVGILAAFLIAFDSLHLTYSWEAMGEVPQTFWVFVALLFSVRIYQEDNWYDYLVAGLAAGLAAATKIYGGYILIAVLAAHFLKPNRDHKLLAAAFLLSAFGAVICTPYAWLDPMGWWANLQEESARQYKAGRGNSPWLGFSYFWQALSYRLSPWWLASGLAGLLALILRRKKADWVFLCPALVSLILIFGFRLRYLRDWDLVNLTPYLSLCAAFGFFSLWQAIRRKKACQRVVLVLGFVLLLFHGLSGLSDAWLARLPDTRGFAIDWMQRYMPKGSTLWAEAPFSSGMGFWPHDLPKVKYKPHKVEKALRKKACPQSVKPGDMLAIERVWNQPRLKTDLAAPLKIFQLRSGYWENPAISFFNCRARQYSPLVLRSHLRVMPQNFWFMNTPWDRDQVIDLYCTPNPRESLVFANRGLGKMGYLAIGRARTSFFMGAYLGFPLEVKSGQLARGYFHPLRNLLPVTPNAYKLNLNAVSEKQVLWMGLYPSPVQMMPLLARAKDWAGVLNAWENSTKSQRNIPEAFLFRAAGQKALGFGEEAKKTIVELKQKHPGFLKKYKNLQTRSGPAFLRCLADMASVPLSFLQAETCVWPLLPGQRKLRQKQGQYLGQVVSKKGYYHLWLPDLHLPGFAKMKLVLTQKKPVVTTGKKVRLRVVGHYSNYFTKDFAVLEIEQSGVGEYDLCFEIPKGPLRLEVVMESEEEISLNLAKVKVMPDLKKEYKWRYDTFSSMWPEMP